MKLTKANLSIGLIVLFLFLTLFPARGYATPPQTLTYRGSLANSAGTPVDGAQVMVFSIYSAATGGTALWTENQAITVANGNYSVILGSVTPINLPFDTQYYLGVKVGTDSEMTPRMPLTSVGYAFNAGNGVPKGGIIMWSGAIDQVPSGWALCDGANGTPNLRDRFIVGAGSGYAVGNAGGAAAINLQHSHTVNSHSHTVNHTHTYSGKTGPPSDQDSYDETNEQSGANMQHTHDYSGTTSGSSAATTGSESPGTNNQLSMAQDIRPPYYALAFIMKL